MNGVFCSQHPTAASAGTCSRCGRFCCDACVVERDPLLCRECFTLVGDPFRVRSTAFTPLGAVAAGLRILWANALGVVLIGALFSVPAVVLSQLASAAAADPESLRSTFQSVRLNNAYDTFIGVLGDLAVIALFISSVEGRKLSTGSALREALPRWGRGIWTSIRAGLWIGLLTIMLVLPGIWVAVMLTFSSVAVVRLKTDALDSSRSLVRGRWWQVFGGTLLAGLVAFAPGFAANFALEFVATLTGFKVPSLVDDALSEVLFSIWGGSVFSAVAVAAYYQLHVSTAQELPPMEWVTSPQRA